MKPKRILTIAGSDSGGGAGIQADLKTIASLGGFGMSVITALTAQNTLGIQDIHEVSPEFVKRQFDSVASDIGIDAAKTGMLVNSGIIEVVADGIREYSVEKLVVDPAMAAKGGTPLIKGEVRDDLIRELIPLALVVTPNISEAEVLSGIKIASLDGMREAARVIYDLGAENVLVKGGHLMDADVTHARDILYDGKNFYEFSSERIDTKDTHGTGCTYSAAIATGLAMGKSVFEAVEEAKKYITETIRFSYRIGGGQGPTNHLAPLLREVERYRCLDELKAALQRLKGEKCGHVIPEVQSNLGYALPGARGIEEVAAVPGRIIRIGDEVATLCEPAFGASSHIAKIILTVLRYNSEYRAAMNIRFSEDIVKICQALGYDIAHFSRAGEPPEMKERDGSSLEWGTETVLAKREKVPDIIFDRGDVGKEPMIRVLGKDPHDVVDKVLNLVRKLKVVSHRS
ncbi:MAG: bifunctional hydroxymethylpyrimidine kinase/phosphomethylpyrimidine kinase [Syntrophales bacterium]|nr:bifunctional hydroxymethylpyrimidine kinase/phosphomethylpyrimidine kinase [Syntrophales bacterium]